MTQIHKYLCISISIHLGGKTFEINERLTKCCFVKCYKPKFLLLEILKISIQNTHICETIWSFAKNKTKQYVYTLKILFACCMTSRRSKEKRTKTEKKKKRTLTHRIQRIQAKFDPIS